MKQLCLIAAIAVCVLNFTNASATIRRVGYAGPHTSRDYPDLQTAQDNSGWGDTIYLFPGTWAATYDKKLITIGYGYYVDTAALGTEANPALQNITGTLSVGIHLTAASDSCVFEGVDGLYLDNRPDYFTDYPISNLTIKRCNVSITLFSRSLSDHYNWKIIQSIVSLDVLSLGQLKFLTISNCVIDNFNPLTYSDQSGMLINNIFTDSWNRDAPFQYKNNIFLADYDGPLNSVSKYDYNVFVGAITGSINGLHNKVNKNMDSIFVGYSNQKKFSNDSRWALLKPNSPAIGAGEGSIDCGIYSGTTPYKISGIPAIPSFYFFSAPSTTSGTGATYQVTFSVKSNN